MDRKAPGAPLTPQAYEQRTVSSAAVALASIPANLGQGWLMALIVVQDAAVRWRDDGTNPTAAVGMPLEAGASFEYDGDLSRLKFIRRDASDAKLNVTYYS